MTPDFALSLSFEGIRLLHRDQGGWTSLGEVPLDSRDLTGALAALRRTGLSLGVPWRGTKLLLPAEQVRTLVIESAEAGLAEAVAEHVEQRSAEGAARLRDGDDRPA